MFKKMVLAGTLLLGGSLLVPEQAEAQVYGPVIRYGGGPVYVPPVTTYRSYGYSPYRSGYRYGYQPYFRGPAFGAPAYRGPVYPYGGPVYRSYRSPYGYPYYAPRRGTGFSVQIGPVYRGW